MATVMVVDDDRVILQLCSQTVEAGGMDVLQAADGNEAIHVAGRYSGAIDLLLSDVVMPGAIDGVRLAEILTSSRPAMKVLLMSGSSNEGLTAHPEWQFIWKPFQLTALMARIEESLAYRIPPKMETNASTRLDKAAGQTTAGRTAVNDRWRKS